jgi:hypothetical protein
MPWPLALNIYAIIFATWAVILSKDIRKPAHALTILVAALNMALAIIIFPKPDHSEKIPAVTAGIAGKFIRIAVSNVDDKYPIKDVHFRINSLPTVEIGTLYKGAHKTYDFEAPIANTTWITVLFYNSTEIIVTDFNISLNADSTVKKITATYSNSKGQVFVPDWQKNAKNHPDTSVKHYVPTKFQ